MLACVGNDICIAYHCGSAIIAKDWKWLKSLGVWEKLNKFYLPNGILCSCKKGGQSPYTHAERFRINYEAEKKKKKRSTQKATGVRKVVI